MTIHFVIKLKLICLFKKGENKIEHGTARKSNIQSFYFIQPWMQSGTVDQSFYKQHKLSGLYNSTKKI